MSRVPLAWRNLTHNRVRFVLALAGVTFAVFLMFMQYGFQNALFDATTALPARLNGELVVTSTAKTQMSLPAGFPLARLHQARSVNGVAEVEPVYVEQYRSRWGNLHAEPGTPGRRGIRAVGVDPAGEALDIPEVRSNAERLRLGHAVLFDRWSRDVYGPREPDTRAELGGNRVTVIDNFRLGTDFTADGTVILSAGEFARTFGHPILNPDPLGTVDLGVVRLKPGADPLEVRDELTRLLPDDVKVSTREELIRNEIEFWRKSTPIGFAFGFGMAMGFLVGVVICYQILSSDVADHLPEYATLKAIGYSNGYLTRVVLTQSLWLSLTGFVPGLVVSWVVYEVVAAKTGLPMDLLRFDRAGFILALTVLMCAASALIAVRRVKSADPADVF